ncbi:MAG: dTDP-4-dehydrorhamnose 3,5-epimerase family protein [Weeksellaceae bacterium]
MNYQPTPENQLNERVYKTTIDGLYYISHNTNRDDRGFFSEVAVFPYLEKATGTPFHIRQINHANSQVNVARGIHTEDWNKYVAITAGICFSAIADVRPASTTFGKVETFLLGHGEDALDGSLFIPAGAGNSMCVVSGPVDYLYFVDKVYADRDTSGDLAITLFDPDLAIEWPIPREQMIISDRDKKAVTLREKYPERF